MVVHLAEDQGTVRIEGAAPEVVLRLPGVVWDPRVGAHRAAAFRLDEIAALERELKFELPKEIQRARELGDLRENAEYKSAKERQTLVEAQISILKKRMGEISLMNLDRIPRDKAGFGSTVHLREGDTTVVYQLVMPEDADVEKGMVSTSSPVGRAILNKEEGDEFSVQTPNGKREFELLKLVTIHDADE